MQISPHFTLEELTRTTTGLANVPSQDVIAALQKLCTNLLEPVRAQFGPLYVHSAYRSPEVNAKDGGVHSSAHLYGAACDFTAIGDATVTEMVAWIAASALPFDQVIDEAIGASRWCHLGGVYALHQQPRKQSLIYRNGEYAVFK